MYAISAVALYLLSTELSTLTFIVFSPVAVLLDFTVKLVDTETGEDTQFGKEGELYLRGPQNMKGYWPTPGSSLTEDGWVASGDIARMDGDGYFYIVDRVKDMANISGYKVYTSTIDEVLFTHPAVSMAVAIGIPDPEHSGSERIKTYIRLLYKLEIGSEKIIRLSEKTSRSNRKCFYETRTLIKVKEIWIKS